MEYRANDLKAFDLIRRAAREYSGAEYAFYQSGFFKFVQKDKLIFIEDIYVKPEHRGTPISQIMMESFNQEMIDKGIIGYYGNVYKANKKSLDKLLSWGMEIIESTDEYDVVFKRTK